MAKPNPQNGWQGPLARQLGLLLACVALVLCTWPGQARADRFDQLMADNEDGRSRRTPRKPKLKQGEVELQLERYQQLREQLQSRQQAPVTEHGPKVVLGAAHYGGEIRDGVLHLTGEIDVTLDQDGDKVVPIVGSSLVLTDARLDGQPLGLIRRSGYHVWITRATGTHKLRFRGLVAAKGPRGSVEYAFGVVRTPSTQVTITIPGQDVAPVVKDAVHFETTRSDTATTVHATLKPTTQVRLLGVHDFGDSSQRNAKLYAESSSLLSINEAQTELFTVIRYNILHASARRFVVDLPAGFEVVEATGVGGFRYEIEKHDGTTRLLGQTARPVRDRFELSLRLRRVRDQQEALSLTPPRCVEVERQHGWLGIEAVGKLQLQVERQSELIDVDVRQLPAELVDSAVSPVLRAYRYIRDNPKLTLIARPLPELDLHNGSIDQVLATSVVADDGTLVTELKLTLRNRLRPTMTVGLSDEARVRSVLLDGKPVKASRDDEHKLVLPLKRSRGSERLEPFVLVVVWEEHHDTMALFGRRQLTLPTLDMEAAAVSWKIYLPGGHHYSEVGSDVAEEHLWTTASWHKPAHLRRAVRWDAEAEQTASTERQSAVAGTLPVRFELPVTGHERTFHRYWLAPGETVGLRVMHMRPWLWRMLSAAVAALLAWLLARIPRLWSRRRLRGARLRLVTTAASATLLLAASLWLSLPSSIAAAVVLAIALWLREHWRGKRWLRIARVMVKRTPKSLARWIRRPGQTIRSRTRVVLAALATLLIGHQLLSGAAELANNLLASIR